jgi:hypothetical protein
VTASGRPAPRRSRPDRAAPVRRRLRPAERRPEPESPDRRCARAAAAGPSQPPPDRARSPPVRTAPRRRGPPGARPEGRHPNGYALAADCGPEPPPPPPALVHSPPADSGSLRHGDRAGKDGLLQQVPASRWQGPCTRAAGGPGAARRRAARATASAVEARRHCSALAAKHRALARTGPLRTSRQARSTP